MTLSALIRKRDHGNLATAIPAISATQPEGNAATVARIATVAVAMPMQGQTVPMAADEEAAIRAWLAMIEETDPATIAEVIETCQRDAEARDYFTRRARAELPKRDPFPDDRRTCRQCSSLAYGGVCSVACPGGAVSANRGYRPAADLLQRCEAFNERKL